MIATRRRLAPAVTDAAPGVYDVFSERRVKLSRISDEETQTMRRWIAGAALALGAAMASGPASAGVFTDDMAKCLVKSTDADDQTHLMQWIFSMMALNPRLAGVATVTEAQRGAYDDTVARLMERLVLKDCHKETVAALKFEGTNVFEASFKVLGEVASTGIMNDPAVAAGLGAFAKHLDNDKLTALMVEGGVNVPAKPAK